MAYLLPDFHNPTGLCLDELGRAELARIARETRMTLVVTRRWWTSGSTGPRRRRWPPWPATRPVPTW